VIGQPGEPLLMGIVDTAGARGQLLGQKGMVDAEPIILRAESGVFASVWIAVPRQSLGDGPQGRRGTERPSADERKGPPAS
jgi:hypothetical protein